MHNTNKPVKTKQTTNQTKRMQNNSNPNVQRKSQTIQIKKTTTKKQINYTNNSKTPNKANKQETIQISK